MAHKWGTRALTATTVVTLAATLAGCNGDSEGSKNTGSSTTTTTTTSTSANGGGGDTKTAGDGKLSPPAPTSASTPPSRCSGARTPAPTM